MQEEEMSFDAMRRYIVTEGKDNKWIIYKKTKDEYCPIGEIYDLSEVNHLFKLINGDFDLTPTALLPPLDEVSVEHIAYVIRRTKGNLTQASGILKIGKSTLYRWIKKWNLSRR